MNIPCSAARHAAAAVTSLIVLAAGALPAFANSNDPWPSLRKELFGDRPIAEDSGVITLYGPAQAEDAAVVPISIRISGPHVAALKAMTIVIDRNPAPVAATLSFGDGFDDGHDVGERAIATRIRVDSFSKVRVVAETRDGKLHMSSRFIAGAGGCSATNGKDPDEALAHLGQTQVKTLADANRGATWREGQIMLRHPNFTGMQMDPRKGTYTPARFVEDIVVMRGDKVAFRMTGGISISENPHIRFTYGANAPERLSVKARDTQGVAFEGEHPAGGS